MFGKILNIILLYMTQLFLPNVSHFVNALQFTIPLSIISVPSLIVFDGFTWIVALINATILTGRDRNPISGSVWT